MELAALEPVRGRNVASRNVPATASRPADRAKPFIDELSTASAPRVADATPALHRVQRGETLSQICRDHLRKQGRVTLAAIYQAVAKVARANGLANPDLILVGQHIDLSVLTPPSRQDIIAKVEAAEAPKSLHKSLPKLQEALAAGPWSSVLAGEVALSSPFGYRKNPITGRWGAHEGVDLAARSGTHIYPLESGTVTFSGWRPGYGKVVEVRHNDGMETVYAHNLSNRVCIGDWVTKRTPLGLVGSTGRSTGPHLHLEVKRHGRPVDPAPYVNRHSTKLSRSY